jgi:hypothetical protein
MYTLHLEIRKTFKYRDGWSGNDQWDYVGPVRVTPPRITDWGNDLDYGATYLQWVSLPRGMDATMAARAVLHTMSGGGCQHEYDCCGCVSSRVQIVRRKGRRLLIRTSEYYNY